MAEFTVKEIRSLMNKPTNIRNMSLLAHYGHGVTTLIDTLMSFAGITAPENEKTPVITIRPTVNSLYFELPEEDVEAVKQQSNGPEFLINLINSQLDFSSAITPTLRVIDGALVVVDAIQGVGVQTETLLRQSLAERIKPVVVINKVDLVLLERKVSKEELYQSLSRIIETLNVAISAYGEDDLQVYPDQGTVAFASALHGWGFTLRQFAIRYARKFGVDRDKMMKRLWGDNFFDVETKTWTTKNIDGEHLERSFNMFILDPIFKIFDAVMDSTKEDLGAILDKLEITLTETERGLTGKQLLKAIMHKFLPAGDAILDMVVIHLPSPVTAQQYRVTTLYEGPMEDECAVGIRNCDPAAPLMLYVTKMVPTSDNGRFYAFGRVFSGMVRSGHEVRIQGPKYVPGRKADLFIKAVESNVFLQAGRLATLEDCPAGNFLLKIGTLTTSETAHNIRAIKFSAAPVVQVAVGVQNPADLPRLIEGLKILSMADSIVEVSTSEAGEHLITAAGEVHLDALVRDLIQDHVGVPLTVSDPITQYCESVSAESSMVALSKSPSKHNRLYLKALPLGDEFTKGIESGHIAPYTKDWEDVKSRARLIADEYGWNVAEARKIWAFAPDTTGPNVLVDMTKGVQYLNEVKDSCIAGLQWATKEGVCAEEPVRGVRFNLWDLTLLGDAIHRGGGQIIPTMRRVVYAASLLAKPVLLEPMLLVEIQCSETALATVYACLNTRRGEVFTQEQRRGMPIYILRAHIPVKDSFGLIAALRAATDGDAFVQTEFDHWAIVPGSPLEKDSEAQEIVTKIRTRKGLSPTIPPLEKYYDKL
ncbi:eukaryotic translation elongation factor 2 [Mycena capillaripes]|nr:eukaryotic translation elongation factor 2 [Mycena capillaripes]